MWTLVIIVVMSSVQGVSGTSNSIHSIGGFSTQNTGGINNIQLTTGFNNVQQNSVSISASASFNAGSSEP